MMKDILFHGRKLSLNPKLGDPFYYHYVRILEQFEDSCHKNPEFIKQFLNKNQKSHMYQMTNKYEKSNSTRKQIENRIDKYSRHYEPMYNQINPYFGKNLYRFYHQPHYRFQNTSNFDSYSRHSNLDFFRHEQPPQSISRQANYLPGPSYQHRQPPMESYPPHHPPFFNRLSMPNNHCEGDYQDNYRNQRHFPDSLSSSRYHPYSRHR